MCKKGLLLLVLHLLALTVPSRSQNGFVRTVGRLQEVFAWRQITFNINGEQVLQDRFAEDENVPNDREKRQADIVFVDNQNDEPEKPWDQREYPSSTPSDRRPSWQSWNNNNRPTQTTTSATTSTRRSSTTTRSRRPNSSTTSTTTTARPSDDANRFFIQYNNLPMGVERVGDRLFVTLPRRRYGIPSTLNYIDLIQDANQRSPGLRPYPSLRESRNLTSVYRTRADECGRLWMVDTGLLEIPGNRQQVQQPAIVIYDLRTNRQILRHPFKSEDIPSAVTPTGLASITVDITNGDCSNAHAYIPDLATYGLLVFSLRDRDSWRLTHNYFNFDPKAGSLQIAGQRFQWNDGIFSVTLTEPTMDGCRNAYFHAMVGLDEYSVSTCVLKNKTASSDSNYWSLYSIVGNRGADSQSTMHGYHLGSRVMFFANIGRDAITCWNTGTLLSPTSIEILAKDSTRLSYPSDLHVTGDEVWVMANSLPTWAYSRLDTNEYNFYIYRANVQDLIRGTVCDTRASYSSGGMTMARQNDDE